MLLRSLLGTSVDTFYGYSARRECAPPLTHISTTNAPRHFFPYWIFTLRSIDRGIKFDSTPTGSRSYGTCRRAYNKRQTVSLVFCRRESAQKAKNEDAADHLSIIGRSQYSALVRALNSACCASRAPNGSIHCRFSLHFPCMTHMILPLPLSLSLPPSPSCSPCEGPSLRCCQC